MGLMLTQAELAAALGVTDRAVRMWKLPRVGDARRGPYDLAAVCEELGRQGRNPPGLEACRAKVRGGAAPPAPPAPPPAPVDAPHPALAAPPPSPTATSSPPTSQPPDEPPSGTAEQGLAVVGRRRSWRAAEQGLKSIEGRLLKGEIKPSPQQVESLARTARMLQEHVKGEGGVRVELTPREVLVRLLRGWRRQWGAAALEELLREAALPGKESDDVRGE